MQVNVSLFDTLDIDSLPTLELLKLIPCSTLLERATLIRLFELSNLRSRSHSESYFCAIKFASVCKHRVVGKAAWRIHVEHARDPIGQTDYWARTVAVASSQLLRFRQLLRLVTYVRCTMAGVDVRSWAVCRWTELCLTTSIALAICLTITAPTQYYPNCIGRVQYKALGSR